VLIAVFWAGGQINWGIHADNFENHGKATIPAIQDANYIWFVINMVAVANVLWFHNLNATECFGAKRATEAKKDN